MATSTLGTSFKPVNPPSLAPILAPFGLTPDLLITLLRDTSAVLVGGAVTHYLWNEVHGLDGSAVPGGKSDLDFWVYAPHDEKEKSYQHYRAFTGLVRDRFTEFFKPLGFAPSTNPDHRYDAAKNQFRTKAEILIKVLWYENVTTGRYFNLVFANSPPAPMMMKTDIPIGRAMVYYSNACSAGVGDRLMVEFDPLVLRDIEDRLLTRPDPLYAGTATEARVAKYLERYGMALRPSCVPVTPVAPVAPVVPPSHPLLGVSAPVDPFDLPYVAPSASFVTTPPQLQGPSGGIEFPPTPVRPHNHSIPDAPPRVRRSGHADEDFSIGPEHPIFGLNPRFLPVVPTFAEKEFASVKPPAL